MELRKRKASKHDGLVPEDMTMFDLRQCLKRRKIEFDVKADKETLKGLLREHTPEIKDRVQLQLNETAATVKFKPNQFSKLSKAIWLHISGMLYIAEVAKASRSCQYLARYLSMRLTGIPTPALESRQHCHVYFSRSLNVHQTIALMNRASVCQFLSLKSNQLTKLSGVTLSAHLQHVELHTKSLFIGDILAHLHRSQGTLETLSLSCCGESPRYPCNIETYNFPSMKSFQLTMWSREKYSDLPLLLSKMPNLEKVSLWLLTAPIKKCITALQQHCAKLTHLSVAYCSDCEHAGENDLSGFTRLQLLLTYGLMMKGKMAPTLTHYDSDESVHPLLHGDTRLQLLVIREPELWNWTIHARVQQYKSIQFSTLQTLKIHCRDYNYTSLIMDKLLGDSQLFPTLSNLQVSIQGSFKTERKISKQCEQHVNRLCKQRPGLKVSWVPS